jgi:addiction module HigA family antidote
MTMHNPPHPGEAIRELCGIGPGLDVSVTDAAARLKIARTNLSQILNGHSGITAPFAIKLARNYGGTARLWLRMQMEYDLWQAEKANRSRKKAA